MLSSNGSIGITYFTNNFFSRIIRTAVATNSSTDVHGSVIKAFKVKHSRKLKLAKARERKVDLLSADVTLTSGLASNNFKLYSGMEVSKLMSLCGLRILSWLPTLYNKPYSLFAEHSAVMEAKELNLSENNFLDTYLQNFRTTIYVTKKQSGCPGASILSSDDLQHLNSTFLVPRISLLNYVFQQHEGENCSTCYGSNEYHQYDILSYIFPYKSTITMHTKIMDLIRNFSESKRVVDVREALQRVAQIDQNRSNNSLLLDGFKTFRFLEKLNVVSLWGIEKDKLLLHNARRKKAPVAVSILPSVGEQSKAVATETWTLENRRKALIACGFPTALIEDIIEPSSTDLTVTERDLWWKLHLPPPTTKSKEYFNRDASSDGAKISNSISNDNYNSGQGLASSHSKKGITSNLNKLFSSAGDGSGQFSELKKLGFTDEFISKLKAPPQRKHSNEEANLVDKSSADYVNMDKLSRSVQLEANGPSGVAITSAELSDKNEEDRASRVEKMKAAGISDALIAKILTSPSPTHMGSASSAPMLSSDSNHELLSAELTDEDRSHRVATLKAAGLSDAMIAKMLASTKPTTTVSLSSASTNSVSTVDLQKEDRANHVVKLKEAGLSDAVIAKMSSPAKPISTALASSMDSMHSSSSANLTDKNEEMNEGSRAAKLKVAGLSDAMIAKVLASVKPTASATAPMSSSDSIHNISSAELSEKDADDDRASRVAKLKAAGLSDAMIGKMLASAKPTSSTTAPVLSGELSEKDAEDDRVAKLKAAGLSDAMIAKLLASAKPTSSATAPMSSSDSTRTMPFSEISEKDAEDDGASRVAKLKAAGLSDAMIAKMLASAKPTSSATAPMSSSDSIHNISSAELSEKDAEDDRASRVAKLKAAGLSDAMIGKMLASAKPTSSATAPMSSSDSTRTMPFSEISEKDADDDRASRVAKLKAAGLSDAMIAKMLASAKPTSSATAPMSSSDSTRTMPFSEISEKDADDDRASRVAKLKAAGLSDAMIGKMLASAKPTSSATAPMSSSDSTRTMPFSEISEKDADDDRASRVAKLKAAGLSDAMIAKMLASAKPTSSATASKSTQAMSPAELAEKDADDDRASRVVKLKAAGLSDAMIAKMLASAKPTSSATAPMSSSKSTHAMSPAELTEKDVEDVRTSHVAKLKAAGLSGAMIAKMLASAKPTSSATASKSTQAMSPAELAEKDADDDRASRVAKLKAAGLSDAMIAKLLASATPTSSATAPMSSSDSIHNISSAELSEKDAEDDRASRVAKLKAAGLSDAMIGKMLASAKPTSSATAPMSSSDSTRTMPFSEISEKDADDDRASRVAKLKPAGLSDAMIAKMLASAKHTSSTSSPVLSGEISEKDAEDDTTSRVAKLKAAGLSDAMIAKMLASAKPTSSATAPMSSSDSTRTMPFSEISEKDADDDRASRVAKLKAAGLSDAMIGKMLASAKPTSSATAPMSSSDSTRTMPFSEISEKDADDDRASRVAKLKAAGLSDAMIAKMLASAKPTSSATAPMSSSDSTRTMPFSEISEKDADDDRASRVAKLKAAGLSDAMIGKMLASAKPTSSATAPMSSSDSTRTMPFSEISEKDADDDRASRVAKLKAAGLSDAMIAKMLASAKPTSSATAPMSSSDSTRTMPFSEISEKDADDDRASRVAKLKAAGLSDAMIGKMLASAKPTSSATAPMSSSDSTSTMPFSEISEKDADDDRASRVAKLKAAGLSDAMIAKMLASAKPTSSATAPMSSSDSTRTMPFSEISEKDADDDRASRVAKLKAAGLSDAMIGKMLASAKPTSSATAPMSSSDSTITMPFSEISEKDADDDRASRVAKLKAAGLSDAMIAKMLASAKHTSSTSSPVLFGEISEKDAEDDRASRVAKLKAAGLSDAMIAKMLASAKPTSSATAPMSSSDSTRTMPFSEISEKDADDDRASRVAKLKAAGLSDAMIAKMLASAKPTSSATASKSTQAMSPAELAEKDADDDRASRVAKLKAAGLSDAMIAKMLASAKPTSSATAPMSSSKSTHAMSPAELTEKDAEDDRTSHVAKLKAAGLSNAMIAKMLASAKPTSSATASKSTQAMSPAELAEKDADDDRASRVAKLKAAGLSDAMIAKMLASAKPTSSATAPMSSSKSTHAMSPAELTEKDAEDDRTSRVAKLKAAGLSYAMIAKILASAKPTPTASGNDRPHIVAELKAAGLTDAMIAKMLPSSFCTTEAMTVSSPSPEILDGGVPLVGKLKADGLSHRMTTKSSPSENDATLLQSSSSMVDVEKFVFRGEKSVKAVPNFNRDNSITEQRLVRSKRNENTEMQPQLSPSPTPEFSESFLLDDTITPNLGERNSKEMERARWKDVSEQGGFIHNTANIDDSGLLKSDDIEARRSHLISLGLSKSIIEVMLSDDTAHVEPPRSTDAVGSKTSSVPQKNDAVDSARIQRLKASGLPDAIISKAIATEDYKVLEALSEKDAQIEEHSYEECKSIPFSEGYGPAPGGDGKIAEDEKNNVVHAKKSMAQAHGEKIAKGEKKGTQNLDALRGGGGSKSEEKSQGFFSSLLRKIF